MNEKSSDADDIARLLNATDATVSSSADGEDWFGEGSAFDSGEELAAALFAMAGGPEPTLPALPAGSDIQLAGELPSATRGDETETPVEGAMVFEALHGHRVAPGSQAEGVKQPASPLTWSIRDSVRTFKMTEVVIERVRQDAINVAWAAAALAIAQHEQPTSV